MNISPVSAKLCMLLNKTTARAYYGYMNNNKLTPSWFHRCPIPTGSHSPSVADCKDGVGMRGMVSSIESICILLFCFVMAFKQLCRPPVRSRWLKLLMNVFNLFAEDNKVQIIEVRN